MIPFANVEDAVEEVVLNIDACRPAAKEEVAVVLVAFIYVVVRPPVITPAPVTDRGVPGVDVPTPRLPRTKELPVVVEVVWITRGRTLMSVVEVAKKYLARTAPVITASPVTPSGVPGVDVPTPRVDVATKLVEEALVVMKPPVNVSWVLVALFGNG